VNNLYSTNKCQGGTDGHQTRIPKSQCSRDNGRVLIPAEVDGPCCRSQLPNPQVSLPGAAIPKYVEPLPVFGPASGGAAPRVRKAIFRVSAEEFQHKVLPASFYDALPAPYNAGTYVWGYRVDSRPPYYPGFTVEALRRVPTIITYVNNLPISPVLQQYITVDQSIHWANPLGLDMMDPARMMPYAGPPPIVTHLHGGEVSSKFDGGPEQWYTPDGLHGAGYRTLYDAGSNAAVYLYPNTQEATTLWFHDHALGATRLNVYAGWLLSISCGTSTIPACRASA